MVIYHIHRIRDSHSRSKRQQIIFSSVRGNGSGFCRGAPRTGIPGLLLVMNGCGLLSAICIRRIWFFIFSHHLQDNALKTCFSFSSSFHGLQFIHYSSCATSAMTKNLYSLLFVVEPQVTIRTFGNSGNILSNVPQGTEDGSLSASFRIGVNDVVFSSV